MKYLYYFHEFYIVFLSENFFWSVGYFCYGKKHQTRVHVTDTLYISVCSVSGVPVFFWFIEVKIYKSKGPRCIMQLPICSVSQVQNCSVGATKELHLNGNFTAGLRLAGAIRYNTVTS